MTKLQPNIDAAIKFLKRLRPAGPWNLNAKAFVDTCFTEGDDEAMRDWMQSHAGDALYYMPNPVATGRAKGKGVDYAVCVHRELDCDKDEGRFAATTLEGRKAEALAWLLSKDAGKHMPGPPSLVIDSGGGLHVYWLLADSIMGEEAEKANIYMRDNVYPDRDGTWDATRILRIPHLVNNPSDEKRARGRVPAMVKVVHEDWDCRYDYWQFNVSERPLSSAEADVFIGAFEDVDEAEMSALVSSHYIPEVTLQLIEQGAGAKDDASSVLHTVMKTLIRRGIPLEKVGGIFTGDWAIADSTVRHKDHGSEGDEGYVRRQLRKAFAKVHNERKHDFPDDVSQYDNLLPPIPATRADAPEDPLADSDTSKPILLKFWSLHELAALPPPQWLIEEWVTEGAFFQIYGARKKHKTFVAIDIACRIAMGMDWHGAKVKQGKVFYVIAEGNKGRFYDRVLAWCMHNGVDWQELAKSFIVLPQPAYLDRGPYLKAVLAGLRVHAPIEDYVLGIWDTLAQNMEGDENSTMDMNRAVKGAGWVRMVTGCAVCVVHHIGKNELAEGRGSTALPGAVDASIKVYPAKGKEPMTVVELFEARDAEAGKGIRMKVVQVMVDFEANRKSLVMEYVDSNIEHSKPSAGEEAKKDARMLVLITLAEQVGGGVQTRKDLEPLTDLHRNTISKAVKSLAEDELITVGSGGGPLLCTDSGVELAMENGAVVPAEQSTE